MSLRNQLVTRATTMVTAACLMVAAVDAAPVAKLTAASLVPSAIFPEGAGRNFGYEGGFTVAYIQTEAAHRWKLAEPAAAFATLSPGAVTTPGEPAAAPAAASTASRESLAETADEMEFNAEVELLGPTFVTIVFADTAAAASDMVASFFEEHKDWMKEEAKEKLPHPNLAVFKIERDDSLRRGAVVYNREFNLGDKQGGFRRASSVVVASGNVFLRVDARKGLSDTEYDGSESILEKRARKVATYLLKMM